MERYTHVDVHPDQEWKVQVLFDAVVKREYERHPKLNSRRKQLIFIQETFGWEADHMQIAHLLGATEKDTKKYLSTRGMRDHEYEEIKDRFDGAFAVASIIAYNIEEVFERADAITRANSLVGGTGLRRALQKGNTHQAVYIAERTFRHVQEGA